LVGLLIDWLVGWGWLIDWLIGWLVGWLIDWLICRPTYCGTQSINQNLYSSPSRSLLRSASDPSQAEKKSWDGCGIENRHHLGSELALLEAHSTLLDQPQKRTGLHCSNQSNQLFITVQLNLDNKRKW